MITNMLTDLKPGDTVVRHIFTGSGLEREEIETVERVTKTQIVLAGVNLRYSCSDGHPVKAGPGLSYITKA